MQKVFDLRNGKSCLFSQFDKRQALEHVCMIDPLPRLSSGLRK